MMESLAFIVVGSLTFCSASWFARLISEPADKWERDGVVRHGMNHGKVWKEDNPRKFAARIRAARFGAGYTRLLGRVIGAILVVAGIGSLILSAFK